LQCECNALTAELYALIWCGGATLTAAPSAQKNKRLINID